MKLKPSVRYWLCSGAIVAVAQGSCILSLFLLRNSAKIAVIIFMPLALPAGLFFLPFLRNIHDVDNPMFVGATLFANWCFYTVLLRWWLVRKPRKEASV